MSPTKFGGPTDGPVRKHRILLHCRNSAALPTNTTAVTRYDYNDYIFRTGIGTDNNVSVSGGKDKTKYYTSGFLF